MTNLFQSFLKSIAENTTRGDAREETYYPDLKNLLQDFANEQKRSIQVTVLPKPTEAGNPDFRVWDGAHQIIGYIEAKVPGTNLEQVETSEQLHRYRTTFPNLILTDFYNFRLYRQGNLIDQALLGRPFIALKLKTTPPAEQISSLTRLLETFLSFSLPPSLNADTLAVELARRTRFLRDQVVLQELKNTQGTIYGFYQAFHKYLIAGLTEEQFSDLYSQTITYGMFAARTRAQNSFNRQTAFALIPQTIGILRDVFQFISLGRPTPQMEVIVDDIAAVLNAADVKSILENYFKQGKGEDPIMHFYETFLAQYDPETRERRGVYYTPQPVVSYIVRSVHRILKDFFNLEDGLADERVTLLDPAAGTLTFPAEAVKLAVQEYVTQYGEGSKANLVRQQILPHFYAFELLMAPYAIAHMKIGFLLESLGVPLQEGERFQLYLTNTLEMEDLQQITIPGLSSLSEESHHAAQIKADKPILVIVGNPPYSGISANQNDWTERMLKENLDGAQSYYEVDGKPLGERNPKWLQDDYVKFLRFAQWKIEQAGRGVVAMITNHGYLDNPTFRGMRQSLMRTFDDLYLLDLHGNSLKREKAPDGSPDENVFDIRQGVAIALFVKRPAGNGKEIRHASLYGSRADKYAWLESHDHSSTTWQTLESETPYYFFIPRATQGIQHYLSWLSVPQIFPVNSVGIVTARDKFVIDHDRRDLENRIQQFRDDVNLPDEILSEAFGLKDKTGWSINIARKRVKSDRNWQDKIFPILYRPFDERFIMYHEAIIERMRPEVMRHMLAGDNLGVIVPRRVEYKGSWQHAFITTQMTEHVAVSLKTIDYHFPLYLYPVTRGQTNIFHAVRKPNLADGLLEALAASYGFTPTPEDLLAYIYAIFYTPAYRQTYAEFLRVDFPRVPFTSHPDIFQEFAALGQRLIALLLLKSPELHPPVVKYPASGDDIVRRVRYDTANERVWINEMQFFEGILPEMWEYQIGGYQVLEKYLKDRKGRRLDDTRRYILIASAIARTMEIQEELDARYPAIEDQVLQISIKD